MCVDIIIIIIGRHRLYMIIRINIQDNINERLCAPDGWHAEDIVSLTSRVDLPVAHMNVIRSRLRWSTSIRCVSSPPQDRKVPAALFVYTMRFGIPYFEGRSFRVISSFVRVALSISFYLPVTGAHPHWHIRHRVCILDVIFFKDGLGAPGHQY